MKPNKCFCVKINRLDFVFLTLCMLHKSYVSLNSMSLAKNFSFKIGFSPCARNFELKSKLKSLAITSCFVGLIWNFSNSSNKLLNTSICSFSVFALYKFIKIYSESLMETLRIKIRPSWSLCFFFKINLPVPR